LQVVSGCPSAPTAFWRYAAARAPREPQREKYARSVSRSGRVEPLTFR
jgi:hypothetical protein